MTIREWVAGAVEDLRDGRTRARRRLDEVFSRDVLGSILVSLSLSKVVESALRIVTPGMYARLAGWIVLAVAFVATFVWWERAAAAAEAAAEAAGEATE